LPPGTGHLQTDDLSQSTRQVLDQVFATAPRSAGEKLVQFLSRAKTERKVEDALKKAFQAGHDKEALGLALNHCAGRGLTPCVRAIIEAGASVNAQDPSQPLGRSTPIQLAASRGHVNAVRLLAEAGADRTGALEASQDLAKLGAVFAEERQAIVAVLKR